jgi:vacuolar-type H+-ATPase subunit I/STV1
MEAGINLKETIESETKYDFDGFNRAALAIFAVRTQGIGSEVASSIKESKIELEGFDVEALEGLDEEQRAEIEASLQDQTADLETVDEEINTEEMQKIREHYDMIMRVRSEFAIPD